MTSRIVPLVVLDEGQKRIVGSAMVNDDGTVNCTITDQKVAEDLAAGSANLGAVSLGTMPRFLSEADIPRDLSGMCWCCSIQQCDRALDELKCFCCRRKHIL